MTLYNDYGTWIQRLTGGKVQKIAVDAGFTCPNRDGTKAVGGCSFCDNGAFNPVYCDRRKSVSQQIEDGKKFFEHKFKGNRYLVYFQSFSNTYASLPHLRRLYEEALSAEGVAGLVIATRPDCVDKDILDYLQTLNRKHLVIVEYGIESTEDSTLRRINRGHDFQTSVKAIEATRRRGILTAAHVILGLPGEDRETMIRQASAVSATGVDILKIHQLQLIRGTRLAKDYNRQPFPLLSLDGYLPLLADYIRRLRPEIALERFVSVSPRDMLIGPKWGLKSYEFEQLFHKYLESHGYRQGDLL